MKTKHTFAFTFVLGLIWTVTLFAYSGGPPEAVNGVTVSTCNQVFCHNSFQLNSGTGSVAIGGLPTTWTPGQTYSLTVTVTGGTRYGFQFTAVSDSSGVQAGTFSAASPNDGRVSICPGGSGCFNSSSLQFAQHNSFQNFSGLFSFRWTAPSSANFGPVRFNVAGNAANNNTQPDGDRIYTTSAIISPAVNDTTAPVISAVSSSSVSSSAATITWTTDEGSDSQVEYGTTTAYGTSTTLNTASVTSHSVGLTGLASMTRYHYRVKSRDASVNLATGSDNTFFTGFSITNLTGVSRSTDGAGSLSVGYGRILATSGTTPSGLAVFGLRQSGILVTEAGVPDSPLITQGRTYAEVSSDGRVNTGLAIANPNAASALISFTIRDSNGATLVSNTTTIPANQHITAFLDQSPYFAPVGTQGTFSFTSSQPVSVIALRSLLNERVPSDFLLTTLPVIDLSATVSTGTQVIPDFAAGGGWTTRILLINPTGTDQTGSIQFLDANGAAQSVTIDGVAGSSGNYTVKANSSKKFVVTGSASTATGSVRVVPTGGGAAPTPLVVFSYKPSTVTVSEAGVPVTPGSTFRMFAQLNASQQINSGVAVANTTSTAGTATFTLFGLDGTQLGQSTAQPLPANGQIVGFLDQLIPALAGQTVQGVLRVTTTGTTSVSVVGLRTRINERSDFLITTTPATPETNIPGTVERLFPDLVSGDGWTTQFVLFSGTSGQTSGGTLSLVSQSGAALDVNIN
jgi:hypothetical protein